MKTRANLFEELYNSIMKYNNNNKLYDYSRIEIFNDYTKHYLLQLKKEFYNLEQKTFLCFNEKETEFLRIKYGAYTNGELYPTSKMAEKMQMKPSEVNTKLEILQFILKRKIIDNIIYMMDGITPKKLIAELNFSTKIKRQLISSNIIYLEELISYEKEEICNIKGIGEKTSQEIIEQTHKEGYLFKDEETERLINTESLKYVLIQSVENKKQEIECMQNQIENLTNKKNKKIKELEALLKRIEELEQNLSKFKK